MSESVYKKCKDLVELTEEETSKRSSDLRNTLVVILRSLNKNSKEDVLVRGLDQLHEAFKRHFKSIFFTQPEHSLKSKIVSMRSYRSERIDFLKSDCSNVTIAVSSPVEMAAVISLVNSLVLNYDSSDTDSEKREILSLYTSLNCIIKSIPRLSRNHELFVMPSFTRPLDRNSMIAYAAALPIFRWMVQNDSLKKVFKTSDREIKSALRSMSQ
jgi:hypothetical protein